jgi:hypothetical protein
MTPPFVEKTITEHAELSDEFVEWVNNLVDWEVESRVGYSKRD